MENAIYFEDVTVAYNDKPVLWDIDLSINKGRITAIVGPNGAGKSTLIKAALNLVKHATGRIEILGEPFSKVKKKIAYVPQTGMVDWDFPTNVLDVITMGTYAGLGLFKRPGKKEIEDAKKAGEVMGLTDFLDRQISALSGGQQQRVFLARALVSNAEIYILDEPLKGVDMKTEEVIMNILRKLKEDGKTVVVVHHDLKTVDKYFDDVVLMNVNIVANGPVSDVFTEENIERTYKRN